MMLMGRFSTLLLPRRFAKQRGFRNVGFKLNAIAAILPARPREPIIRPARDGAIGFLRCSRVIGAPRAEQARLYNSTAYVERSLLHRRATSRASSALREIRHAAPEISYPHSRETPISAANCPRHAHGTASPRLLIGRDSRLGAFYVVTTVLHRRAALFLDPGLAHLAAKELQLGAADSFAWVIMPDHVHWLLRIHETPLARCMQSFKSRSARAINAARGSSGSVCQAGYYDRQLRDEEDLREQARYIVANPVRRGLATWIEDYPHWWCSWISATSDL